MNRPEPFATHKLPNGWIVREHHSTQQHVFFEEPVNPKEDNEIGRFVVRYNRRHHSKTLTVIHLIGSTQEEQKRSRGVALRWAGNPARFPLQGLWGRCRDPLYPGKRFYTITLGDPVDEASAFERLRCGLHTDDAVDLEFQSIVQRMSEVGAA